MYFVSVKLPYRCIVFFSLYTVLVLFSSFSLPFLSFLLQVLVLSTLPVLIIIFIFFLFFFIFVSEQLSFWASLFIRVFFSSFLLL